MIRSSNFIKKMGTYRRQLSGDAQYASFVPDSLFSVQIDESRLKELLEETRQAFAELNRSASTLTDEEVKTFLKKEAESSWMLAAGKYFSPFGMPVLSIFWTLEEQVEISHLEKALLYALESRQELPVCGRMLKNAHYLICSGPLYEKKYPGEFRVSPGWIGKQGCSLQEALFVPPVYEDLTNAFSELEQFIHAESEMDPFVKAALIHYQFETIHPFIDANGRVGRLLNLLFLLDNGVIVKPVLLLSDTLGKYAGRYETELQKVHETGEYEPWIIFFLYMLKEAATSSQRFFSA